MHFDWIALIAALLLLCPPLPVHGSLRRMIMESRSGTTNLVTVFRAWQNWADFVRAATGVFLLNMAISIDPTVENAGRVAFALKAAIVSLGVLVQVVRWKEAIQFFSPIFYLSGITLVFAGASAAAAGPSFSLWEGGFALFVGWLTTVMGRKIGYQLPVMGVALGVYGYVAGSITLPLVFNCLLIFVPWLMSFLFQKDLLLATRQV